MKNEKNKTGDILLLVGLFLVIIQVFVTDNMLENGTLIIPQYVNLATAIYDLIYWFGFSFVGIVGLVMAIIGFVMINRTDKK